MQQLHIGNAEFAGIAPLFAATSVSICTLEATMSVLSFLHTSLLDLAERKLGLFLPDAASLDCRKIPSASDVARPVAQPYRGGQRDRPDSCQSARQAIAPRQAARPVGRFRQGKRRV
jgi:hypothetical protein